MKAMILAAGLGSRMQPLTRDLPKPLLDVNGISLIEYTINNLRNHGIKEFIINVSYLGEKIKNALKSIEGASNIIFLDEPYPFGTGGALLNAKDSLGSAPFILSTSDILFNPDLTKIPDNVDTAHLIATNNPEHHKGGDFSLNKELVYINEGSNDFTYSGVSVINPRILEKHVSKDYPFDLWRTILTPLIKRSKVTGHFDDSFWIDVGTPERLKLARKVLKDQN
tara:strand:+ start:510 stop:1181 length:672 start_codon:yes stop_codon:yes gene_type:complete